MKRGATSAVLLAIASFAVCSAHALAAEVPSGQIMVFGENIWGQLGNGSTQERLPTPEAITLTGATGSPTQLAASLSHTLVLTSSGQLFVIGSGDAGDLGTGSQFSEFYSAKAITLPGATGSPVQVAASVSNSMVLTSSGQLYAFGSNISGQLGIGAIDYEAHATPEVVTLPGATGATVQIAAGREYSLALTSSGQLYAFGDDNYGQLGSPDDYYQPTPETVTLPGATGPPVQIAAGEHHTLVLTSSGQLYTFGDDDYGQLGNGSTKSQSTPQAITLPGASGSIVQIAAGGEHSLVLTSSDQLYTFGSDKSGQLGNGSSDTSAHSTPEAITLTGLKGSITQISGGAEHSLVLSSSGQLYTFGNDKYGQLGNNKSGATPYPTPAPALLTAVTGVSHGSTAEDSLAITASPLAVSTSSLPQGTQNTPYTATATATGGVAPLRWSASGLPGGLSIDAASGQISGTPSAAGSAAVTLTATDAYGTEANSAPIELVIAAPQSGPSGNPPGASNNTGGEPGNTTLGTTNNLLSGPLAPPPPATGTLASLGGGSTIVLTLTCQGAGGQSCSGSVTLTAHEKLRGKKLLALTSRSRKTAIEIKTITLATSAYTLAAGARATVTLTLNAAAKRLLALRGALPATLTLTGAIKTRRTLELKATKHAKNGSKR